MRSRRLFTLGASALMLAAPAMVFYSTRQGMADDEAGEGRIVEIAPSEGDEGAIDVSEESNKEVPQYWIGLQGRPIDSAALRTHLQLASDVGVLVENVVPDSPAQKAGLQQHDVIVSVNGEPISDLSAVQKVVAAGGDKPIELKIIRLAQESKVKVTPEKRPADAMKNLPPGGPEGLGFGAGQMPDFDAVMKQLQEGNLPGGVRVFGPGMVLGSERFNLNSMPNGISVSISRDGEGPAEITVKKGDESWTLKSDDEKAIKKLPDDVRPFVQQMISGAAPGQLRQPGGLHFDMKDLEQLVPHELRQAEGVVRQRAEDARERTEAASERLLKRMEEMEQRIQDLQQQLEENSTSSRTKETEAASNSK
jgi:membrane-associated protease RseP (regulator of RpoE activity)